MSEGTGGRDFSISMDFFKNATVIIGIVYMLYQGSAFITQQVKDIESLRNDIGRVQTKVEKVETQIGNITANDYVYQENVKKVDKLSNVIDDIRQTLYRIEAGKKD